MQGNAGVSVLLKFLCHPLVRSWLSQGYCQQSVGDAKHPLEAHFPFPSCSPHSGLGDLSCLCILGAASLRMPAFLASTHSPDSSISSCRSRMLRSRERFLFHHRGKNFKNSDASWSSGNYLALSPTFQNIYSHIHSYV